MLLLIDNYDSFGYMLLDYFRQLGIECIAYRNNEISIAEIEKLSPRYLVISPGPGTPSQAGITLDVIRHFAGKIPILGVCLGHQAIGQVYGGHIVRASQLMHGKTSAIYHNQQGLFAKIPSPFIATRYHSLVIESTTCPPALTICAQSTDSEIMGIKHQHLPLFGVQFHPESILTEYGLNILQNFLTLSNIFYFGVSLNDNINRPPISSNTAPPLTH